jgi:predicted dehydrogenase
MSPKAPLRLAIAGGHRGSSFTGALSALQDRIQLVAICDPSEPVRSKWLAEIPEITAYSSFDLLLDDPNVDAVFIATPMTLHASQAVQALKAGKHVLSEVIAATSLEECWELVKAVEKTGLTYMMAENYCYRRETMFVRNMAEQGAFGDITFAEGAYIHDCRDLNLFADGSRTWRGNLRSGNSQLSRGNGYPTHSLGPVAQWLGINQPGERGDRLLRTTTFVTKSAARHEWAQSVLPEGHQDTAPEAWENAADSASTLIQTEKGRVISLRFDSASPRPHNMVHYSLQGTNGAFLSRRHDSEEPLVWLKGVSPGVSPANFNFEGMARPERHREMGHPEWQALWELAERYEHPLWQKQGEEALKSGHGGGDFFVLQDFANAVLDGSKPAIDVYDAVTWSSITPLSIYSVADGGMPMDVPRFDRR